MAMRLIDVQLGDLRVGDEFIDFQNGDRRYTIGWFCKQSAGVECYPADDEGMEIFDIEDDVQIERYIN